MRLFWLAFLLPTLALAQNIPAGITAGGNCKGDIFWQADPLATYFTVYRGTAPGAETNHGTTPTPFLHDDLLACGQTYYYTITSTVVTTDPVTLVVTTTEGAPSPEFSIVAGAPSPVTSASFVTIDTTTQGMWWGVYGADGWQVANDTYVSIPSYAALTVTGNAYTWDPNPTNPAAAVRPENPIALIASGWWSYSKVDLDLNLIDGQTHQIAVYVVDYDSKNRSQSMTVTDALTGAILDQRTLATGSYVNGQWLAYLVKGHVKIDAQVLHGPNPIISAVMFQ
jgi:hypothetical protein